MIVPAFLDSGDAGGYMRVKKIAALLAGGAMALSVLAGCGEVNKEAEAAVFDDTKVSMGLANFAVRLYQAEYDEYYRSIFGEDVWSSDFFGSGTTMEDDAKINVMDMLQEMHVLRSHMEEYGVSLSDTDKEAIAGAASDFIAANGADAVDALGAEEAVVEEYLTLETIRSRMQEAIRAGADVSVSDEEANTGTYSYVTVSRTDEAAAEDNTETALEGTEQPADTSEELSETVRGFAAEAKESGLESAATSYAYTVLSGTFTAEDDSLDEEVLAALKELEEGGVSDLIETDESYYVVRLDAETDAGATEETRKNLMEERRDEHYNEVLEGWKKDHTWKVNERNWAKVEFDNFFTTTIESTETEPLEDTTES